MRPVHRGTSRRLIELGAVALVVTVALAVLAAGCGESETTSSSSPSASTAATWTEADLAAVETDSSLTALLPSDIQSSGEIKCLSDIPYPPWEYYDPATSTNPAGFDYDLSQALGKKLGVTVDFIDKPFDSILLQIKGGNGDMSMSAMYDNAERQAAGFSFVDYSMDGTGMIVVKGNPNGIATLDDLAGQTVACENGTTQQAFLTKLNKQFLADGKEKMQILSLPGQPEALLAVKSNRAVADLTDYSTAVYIAMTTNDGKTFEVVEDEAAPYDPQMDGIAILSKNTELINAVQKALQALIDDGTYSRIVDSWDFVGVESATVNAGPEYAASHTTEAE